MSYLEPNAPYGSHCSKDTNARTGRTSNILFFFPMLNTFEWQIQLYVLVLLKLYNQFMSNAMLRIYCVVEYNLCMHKLDVLTCLHFFLNVLLNEFSVAICYSKICNSSKSFCGFKLLLTYPCFVCK